MDEDSFTKLFSVKIICLTLTFAFIIVLYAFTAFAREKAEYQPSNKQMGGKRVGSADVVVSPGPATMLSLMSASKSTRSLPQRREGVVDAERAAGGFAGSQSPFKVLGKHALAGGGGPNESENDKSE